MNTTPKSQRQQKENKTQKKCCTKEKLLYLCKVNEKQKYRTITFYKDYFQAFFELKLQTGMDTIRTFSARRLSQNISLLSKMSFFETRCAA